MAIWNRTKRPVKYANGDSTSPPLDGYFALKVVVTGGVIIFNGETLAVGEQVSLSAPANRTLSTPEFTGGGTYTWHGMR